MIQEKICSLWFANEDGALTVFFLLLLFNELVFARCKSAPVIEKDKFYSSIIRVLGSDPLLVESSAHARALVLRAQTRYEEGRLDEALSDAIAATQVACASPTVQSVAWRTVSDAYRSQGNLHEAIEALREWERVDPSYRTKIRNEIAELVQSL